MKIIRRILSKVFTRSVHLLEKIRILRVLIFMCCISFSFKISHSLSIIYVSLSNNPVFAFEDDAAKKKEKKLLEDQIELPRLETSKEELKKFTQSAKENKIDMMNLTPEAINGLHDIVSEQNQQKERAESIGNREELLKLHEERLSGTLEKMKEAQKQIVQQMQTFNYNDGEKRKKLIEIMEKMPPKKAAPMLENMEKGEASVIIESMKPSSASAILSLMSTEKAAKITKEMIERLSAATDIGPKKPISTPLPQRSPSPLPEVPKFP